MINEVKIGDIVSFRHNKKQVTGKVIHRHSDKEKAFLAGHVNVEVEGGSSYPVTIHVSKLKPAVKEETYMEHIHENIEALVDSIDSGNNLEAQELFNQILQNKINELMDSMKVELSQDLFNSSECADCEEETVEEAKKMKDGKGAEKDEEEEEDEEEDEDLDEALKGKQHKIDANKNGKLDAQDFKMLRAKKGMKEEAEQIDEYQKGLFRPPTGFTKKGMEKGGGVKTTLHYAKKSGSEPVGATMKLGRTTVPLGKTPPKPTRRVKEEVEQVDELKKSTLQSYADKVGGSRGGNDGGQLGGLAKKAHAEVKSGNTAAAQKTAQKFVKREKGLKTAVDKLHQKRFQEEVEQVDELKKSTLQNYVPKAAVNMSASNYKGDAKKVAKRIKGIGAATQKMKEEVEQVDEVITKKTPTGEVIKDFVHSKNPKFKGKSKKERIRMALGAKYGMMKKGK